MMMDVVRGSLCLMLALAALCVLQMQGIGAFIRMQARKVASLRFAASGVRLSTHKPGVAPLCLAKCSTSKPKVTSSALRKAPVRTCKAQEECSRPYLWSHLAHATAPCELLPLLLAELEESQSVSSVCHVMVCICKQAVL
jgi:hypothetical protein